MVCEFDAVISLQTNGYVFLIENLCRLINDMYIIDFRGFSMKSGIRELLLLSHEGSVRYLAALRASWQGMQWANLLALPVNDRSP